ncbi:hypothetical protein KM043_003207 [Ampulex compressa]|nr:hypothetical protein KM043_003207 [Ampulex compressa]
MEQSRTCEEDPATARSSSKFPQQPRPRQFSSAFNSNLQQRGQSIHFPEYRSLGPIGAPWSVGKSTTRAIANGQKKRERPRKYERVSSRDRKILGSQGNARERIFCYARKGHLALHVFTSNDTTGPEPLPLESPEDSKRARKRRIEETQREEILARKNETSLHPDHRKEQGCRSEEPRPLPASEASLDSRPGGMIDELPRTLEAVLPFVDRRSVQVLPGSSFERGSSIPGDPSSFFHSSKTP